MSVIQNVVPSGKGFVRLCFSRRQGAQAVSLDLLRVVCRVASRCAVRGRVREVFAGYLVTDAGPGVVPMFSASRKKYSGGVDVLTVTGGGLSFSWGGSGQLDAPAFIAAGGVYWFDSGVLDYSGPKQKLSMRGGL